MNKWLLGLAAVLVILAVTNPTRDDFNQWAVRYTSHKIDQQAAREGREASSSEKVVGGALVGLVVANVPVQRQNFIFFSIYRMDEDIVRLDNADDGFPGCALGIAGQFVGFKKC